MARTRRGIPYKHYWGSTKEETKKWADYYRGTRYQAWAERAYLLHGTDAKNHSMSAHEYYNRAHRVGRRIEREQLRTYMIDEDYDFDDSHYRAKYKGVWWEVY